MPTIEIIRSLRIVCIIICYIPISITLLSVLPCSASDVRYTSFEQVKSSRLPEKVLIGVLARNYKSKRYDDLVPLDGGTVGIANFARGGLASLYRSMDTQRYFNRSRSVMINMYSAACRPLGRAGNDTGWGCYSKPWWKRGMTEFLASAESKGVQKKAWLGLMEHTIKAALKHHWNNDRTLAIAMGIGNSMGSGGFTHIAALHGWDPEQTLSAYVGQNSHRERRKQAINDTFPI